VVGRCVTAPAATGDSTGERGPPILTRDDRAQERGELGALLGAQRWERVDEALDVLGVLGGFGGTQVAASIGEIRVVGLAVTGEGADTTGGVLAW
jgi:hypothetical protein